MKATSMIQAAPWRVASSEATDVALAFAIVVAAAAWLCLGETVPPLADYPDNLARFFIQAHAADDPQITAYYQLFWHFQPNLALDGLAYLLSPFLDIHTVGRLTVWATFVSLLAGCVLLHRALHGHFSAVSLLAGLLVINRYFTSGFLGFLLTLGWSLIALAAWVHWRNCPPRRLLVGTVLATALYFGHLYAFGTYAVCVLGYELHLLLSDRTMRQHWLGRGIIAGLHLVPALLLFLTLAPTVAMGAAPEWRPLRDKLAGIVVLFPGYNLGLEGALLAIVLLGLGLAWLLGWAVFRRDFLIAEILLGLLYMAMPNVLMTSYGADRRVVVPMAMLAILSFNWRAATQRLQLVPWVLFAGVMATQMVHVAIQWRSAEPMMQELLSLTRLVENGARVAGATVIRTDAYLSIPPLHEVVSLFVPERSALVPNVYSYPGDAAAPIRYRHVEDSFRPPVIYAPPGMSSVDVQAKLDRLLATAIAHRYRYFLLVDEAGSDLRIPALLHLIGATTNGRGRLFQIRSPDEATTGSVLTP